MPLTVQDVRLAPPLLHLSVESTIGQAACPLCGALSRRIHSRYERHLDDLPWGALAVRLRLLVRRFFCVERTCERRVFTERLSGWVGSWARRTLRLEGALRLFGFALGGEAGARLAASLGMVTSPDTIIRLVLSAPLPPAPQVSALGIDDWAWKKGLSYGTILVDLARRRVLDLLPDRAADSLARWLEAHPEIEIIARDRAGCYAEGASRGAPQAQQVADRWHLLANLTDATRRVVERRWRAVQDALRPHPPELSSSYDGPVALTPKPINQAAPPAPFETASRARRLARFEQVRALHRDGLSLRDLARQLGMSRNTVRRFLRAEHFPERAKRPAAPSMIAEHHDYLRKLWEDGCRGQARLHQALEERGYSGSVTPVRRWIAWMRQTQSFTGNSAVPVAERLPTVRQVTWLLSGPDKELKEGQKLMLDKLGAECSQLATTQSLARAFGQMVRQRRADELDGWLEAAASSGVKEFEGLAWGIRRDRDAVHNALQTDWSSGQVEGQVHRLKLVKRQMYGRAGFALLRQRVLHPI